MRLFNTVLLIKVIERNYVYPVKVATAPPCSYTLLLMEVEKDLTDFHLVFKKMKYFFQQIESSAYLSECVEPKKVESGVICWI